MTDKKPLLSGEVFFDKTARLFAGADMILSLVDITLTDAPAKTVIKKSVSNVSYDPEKDTVLTFELDGNISDERAIYALEVLIDVDKDGKLSRGDYINMQSYPVLTRGFSDFVSISVSRVN